MREQKTHVLTWVGVDGGRKVFVWQQNQAARGGNKLLINIHLIQIRTQWRLDAMIPEVLYVYIGWPLTGRVHTFGHKHFGRIIKLFVFPPWHHSLNLFWEKPYSLLSIFLCADGWGGPWRSVGGVKAILTLLPLRIQENPRMMRIGLIVVMGRWTEHLSCVHLNQICLRPWPSKWDFHLSSVKTQ